MNRITGKPFAGWAEDLDKIEALLKSDPEALAMFRHEIYGTLSDHGANQHSGSEARGGDGVTSSGDRGNSNNYWQSRIAAITSIHLQETEEMWATCPPAPAW